MTRTKRSLLLSAVSLLLCLSMLVGTTWAWFTDSVTSAGNRIISGSLDADLLHLADGDWISLSKKTEHKVFDYDKWEPGYTGVEQLKAANLGNLAFKYRIGLMVEAGTEEQGANGERLSDVIDVYIFRGASEAESFAEIQADSAWTRAGTLSEVMSRSSFAEGGLTPAGESATANAASGEEIISVALHMQESAGNEYQKLSVGNIYINMVATQLSYESDSFGDQYDVNAIFPSSDLNIELVANVETNADNTTKNDVIFATSKDGIVATVPAGTLVNAGTTQLKLTVTELKSTNSNITVDDDQGSRSIDVHVEGIAKGNIKPVIVNVAKMLRTGMNIGNYTLYHVEDGAPVAMTAVSTAAELDAHNEFVYDPTTGDVTLALASFSEVAVVADAKNIWEGNFDYSWYDDFKTNTEFVIANADQLAAFGAIVGGMKKVTGRKENGTYTYSDDVIQDSFAGKTVKLIADIDLGDKESKNNPDIIFYPIGYNSDDGKYEKTGVAINSSLKNFEGTFDGNGHTVSNFYQNTWEMKGDHNWYSPEEQYYRDGMGLFGRVYGGTVKNLTVKNFTSDGEIATTGVIAAYADGATFENIAIFECNPRVYNIGNGGIVGCVGWYAKEADLKTTFKNITVDNSNKISALWGSYDVACGGIVGQYYPTSGQSSANYPVNDGMHFENCHVSAQMDVYNDVCANYQYYAYRYSGMLIGSVRENETINGHSYPKMDGITAKDCTVHFGTWNDYYYCEIIDNTTASYTHDYQMSRLEEIKAIDGTTITYLDGTTGTVPASGRANYVIVDYSKGHGTENATCYHFKDGVVWNHEMGGIQEGVDENGDGKDDLKEDKQHIYLEFNNLVTGYGWGVTSKGVGDLYGVTILDREEGNSVEKFEPVDNNDDYKYSTGSTVYIGDLFKPIENAGVAIVGTNVQVTVSPVGESSTASAIYTANTDDWTQGTLVFSGTGSLRVTITDYYFCKPTVISIGIGTVDKFETKFINSSEYLYRVGNQNAVSVGSLFKAKDDVKINEKVDFEIESVAGSAVTGNYTPDSTWTKGTVKFENTGIVKVTISSAEGTAVDLYLEVVDAVNATSATNATSNNVVLLNDIGSGFTVSGRYTVYGNGFTLNYTGNGQYLNNGLKQGIVTVSENGTLDNLRIEASIYPKAYMYYGKTTLGDYVQGGPSSVEGDKTRYHYQLSAVAASGNATISNCYIYGARNNVFVNTGDVTIKNSVLECGVVANVQIQSNASHTVTFENVTTIQHQVYATIKDTSNVMLGAGVLVGPDTNENPKIVLNGDFKQYNWVTAEDKDNVSGEMAKRIIGGAVDATEYNHTVNGKTASNLGIIYMNDEKAIVDNNTELPYQLGTVTMSYNSISVNGQVYSLKNAPDNQIYSDYANADKTTVNGLYEPQFKYPEDLGGQRVDVGGDEHCYREGDTIYVLFPSGDTKELDLVKLVDIVKYTGQDLGLEITVKDENGNAVTVTNGKVSLSEAGKYTVTYKVTDSWFYDKDGDDLLIDPINYSWDVTIDVSLKDTKIPDARFEFDATKQKMGYNKPSFGDVKQYLPFLEGLKIYDYNGQTEYLRFDGSEDFNKIASITITGYESNKALVEIKLTDGGVISTRFLARANSGGASTYTGKIKTSGTTVYFVNDGGTSNKDTTTTAAYWYVDYYKFTGNNGVAIQSGQQTFKSTGSSASTPSGSFSTSIKYTVTYDANGGNCVQTVGYATNVATAVTLPTPTRSGYIFAGWYTAAEGGSRVGGAGDSYTPSSNITLYAQWGKPCNVTYNANGGSCGTASEKYTGTALTLPTPTRDGYWFVGWYDAAEGGNKIGDAGAAYNPSGETTLYAHWQEKVEYTVTYNANGGSCGTASATYQGTALKLPTPTRTGYTFNGWYTAASGGTKIGDAGASYTPSANITLYAQWNINSYTITVTTENATVKVNGTQYNNGTVSLPYGTQVTVEVTYSQNNNRSTTIKGADGTTYTSPFNMPAQNVTINATSDDGCVTSDTLVTLADGTQKRIDELTYEDKLLVWDFERGVYAEAYAYVIVNHGYDLNDVIRLTFADGTEIKVVNVHGFFDAELNRFVDINAENAESYIGHSFIMADGDTYKSVELTSVETWTEYNEAWSLLTEYKYVCFVNGLLSITPSTTALVSFFEVGEGMKYDAEAKAEDIEKYGLYTYEEFDHLMSYELFVALNVAEAKIAVEKGLITYEAILALIDTYVNN